MTPHNEQRDRDIAFILGWLSIGLGCAAFMAFFRLFDAVAERDWIQLGFSGVALVMFVASCIGASKREGKYRQDRR